MPGRILLITANIVSCAFAASAPAQISARPLPPPAGASYGQSDNRPVESTRVSAAYAPPPVNGPQWSGYQRGEWLAECERRLNATAGANAALSPGVCQSWWAYYQAGGAPDPTYGYAIPISMTETTTVDCPPASDKPRVYHPRIKRRILHDKRIRL